jgi:hypothetical protein
MLCVHEELASQPAALPQALHLERAAAEELCALIHWLFFVLDERLHAAVCRRCPPHTAEGGDKGIDHNKN